MQQGWSTTVTERVIINPWTAETLPQGDDNPFKDMPAPHYRALFWGVVTDHPNVPLAGDAEGIEDCIRGLSAKPGRIPGKRMSELYDAYYQAGGPGWGLPYWVSEGEAQAHIKEHLA